MSYDEANNKNIHKKLSIEGKTWHLEFIFDAPIFKDFVFNGQKVQKAIFAFKDLDDDTEFTTIMTASTKVVHALLDYRKGDQIDITYKSGTNRMGQPIHYYDVLPLGTTPNTGGPQYERREDNVTIGDAQSSESDLSKIDW